MNDKSDTEKWLQQLNCSRKLRVGNKLSNLTTLINKNDHDRIEETKLPTLSIAYHKSNEILTH